LPVSVSDTLARGDVIVRLGSIEVKTPEDMKDAKLGDVLVILRDGKELSITLP
jgi:hypothetical protein